MNNEIGRKITSLTLMTIMIAGGMTFALPGVMPAAHAQANANLFVSVEESFSPDRFGGAMVVEVVINDPDLKEIDEAESEPDVTVNGNDIRMTQATDGNWYAYFADATMANAADALSSIAGEGLDFGVGCTAAAATGFAGPSFSDTVGVYFPKGADATPGVVDACAGVAATPQIMNVVRENKTATDFPVGAPLDEGQIGLALGAFPFIQLYDFTAGGNAKIQYNIGGGSPQTVTLEFDDALEDYGMVSTDRTSYPQSANVHITISDNWLNVDPTDEDSWSFGTNSTNSTTVYQAFDENGVADSTAVAGATADIQPSKAALNAGDLGALLINYNPNGAPVDGILTLQTNADQILTESVNASNAFIPTAGAAVGGGALGINRAPVTVVETESSSGIFENTDDSDVANIVVAADAPRGTTATIDYNDSASSILVANFFGSLEMDEASLGGEWNSGEEIGVLLNDMDLNLNSKIDEDIDLSDSAYTIIPSLKIGSPTTLAGGTVTFTDAPLGGALTHGFNSTSVDSFSDVLRAVKDTTSTSITAGVAALNFTFAGAPAKFDPGTTASKYRYLNYDIRSIETAWGSAAFVINATNATASSSQGATFDAVQLVGPLDLTGANLAPLTAYQGIVDITAVSRIGTIGGTEALEIDFLPTLGAGLTLPAGTYPMVVDIFEFGKSGDGNSASERFNNAIYRLELEETGDNTGAFEGSVEYIMLNQLNINKTSTYLSGIDPISDAIEIIVHEDLTDEDAPRINYLDLGADGVSTQVADQQEAPTHSGVVTFDSSTYKVADTVVITLEDQDLNVDVETIDIFTVVRNTPAGTGAVDDAFDTVGELGYGLNSAGEPFGRLLDVTLDDSKWTNFNTAACIAAIGTGDDGLGETGFSLVETGPATGIFRGDFQIPATYCTTAAGAIASATGVDLEVNYVDFRDASGEIIEVGDGAGIRANTGSVSLDRTVYPVPWAGVSDLSGSIFPVHATSAIAPLTASETLGTGDLTIHVRVNDPDFDISASGEDTISLPAASIPPVKLTISRGSAEVTLGYAGGSTATSAGVFDVKGVDEDADDLAAIGLSTGGFATLPAGTDPDITLYGAIEEIAPDAGIFESDITIRFYDGPSSATCPTTAAPSTALARSESIVAATDTKHCILQGDIITVEYTDPTDASGDPNTVTDSATFDLRNGVLQSDKSVYIIGSDMILTVIEPDWDLDNDGAETYDLDAIEWDSDAATVTMGNLGATGGAFDPEPSDLRETGDSTGIFQIVIEIPDTLLGDKLERGEEIVLEYTDWGPSGADFVGDEDEDVNLTIFTSNFGATVELDQKVYSWTDKVYITIVAPDHNFDSNLIDEIGDTTTDPIKVATRGSDIDNYKLVETGTDTGIFTGEVILTGFDTHDADGDGTPGDASGITSPDFGGPTDGFLEADDDDGITVSFEFSEDETVVGSALIRWNIGEVQWLEASYPATGTGVVRVVDPDLNLNPEAVNNFDVDVWSDSDAGGIDLTVTETNEATGIFEGTVFFTITDESSGHRLRVSEGDTITAEYEDNTLPDPYTTADELDITGTSIIGTIVPPLERAPASGLRVVDAFGNSLGEVSVDQQVQITSDLANGQDRDQAFAYLVQVQDGNGVTVSLAWITGSLTAGQSFSPALSWIPDASGTYTATAFVWESVDNPTALSPPVTTSVNVN